jgi:y4mF family transcriptional regulator
LRLDRKGHSITERENIEDSMSSNPASLPYGRITSVEEIGGLVRAHRKAQSVTQAEFAALCGVGTRFISDLENGKPTMELGKVLHVLHCLGLEVIIESRGWSTIHQTSPELESRTAKGAEGD